MRTIEIQPAQQDDIPGIMHIFTSCAQKLREDGLETWTDEYPTREMVIEDLLHEQVFVVTDGQQVVGTVTLTHDIDIEVLSHISWLLETDNYLTIARLGVLPSYQGKGIGSQLFDFALARAERQGYRSIRLVVLTRAARLISMYEQRGFSIVGDVIYDDTHFSVMETLPAKRQIIQIRPGGEPTEEDLRHIQICQDIRKVVFIEGQQVDSRIELDGKDLSCDHLLLYCGCEPAGCLRLRTVSPGVLKLERFAVLPSYRGRGLGEMMLRYVLEMSRAAGTAQLTMHAQYYLLDYYRRFGFVPVRKPFYEAEIQHITMDYQCT